MTPKMTAEALMLFAAGRGTRMGALTAERPKPLIEVAGLPLIDHALALVPPAGLRRVVVNAHYRAAQLATHLATHPQRTTLNPEPLLLETGGGLRAALPLLGPGAVFTLNSDAVWTGPNPLLTLRAAWRPGIRALLLLVPADRARGRQGPGDFSVAPDGRLRRGGDLVYTGAQIIEPSGIEAIPGPVFSLNLFWDRLAAEGGLFGTLHPGGWADVGHPGGIAEAEAMLAGAGSAG